MSPAKKFIYDVRALGLELEIVNGFVCCTPSLPFELTLKMVNLNKLIIKELENDGV